MISFSASALEGLLELGHPDELLVAARGEDRRLVDEVGEIGTGEARRLLRDLIDGDRLVEWLALRVDAQDLHAALHVRAIEDHLAVEAAGAQQSRVEDVRPVGRRDHDHARVRVEAVHLDEDLVEGLLALVVAAAEAGAALAADRVDLVDEDDARRVALGLVEQVAHAAGADADEHLHELGAGDAEEGHAGLAGDRAGHERLAGARRAHQEDAARDARAERVELLGVLEELHDLLELRLGLVDAGHVRERHDGLVAEEHPGPALAEAHGLVVGALGLPHHEEEEAADQQDRQEGPDQQADPLARLRCLLAREGDRRGLDAADLGGLRDVGEDVGEADAGDDHRVVGARVRGHGQPEILLDHGLDLALLDAAEERRVRHRVVAR